MRDVHDIYTTFKTEFPELSARINETSHAIHVDGGPLDEKTRALIKIAAAGAAGHHTALETHVVAAREAGLSDAGDRAHATDAGQHLRVPDLHGGVLHLQANESLTERSAASPAAFALREENREQRGDLADPAQRGSDRGAV